MTAGIFSGIQTLFPVNHRCYQTTLLLQMFSQVWIMVTPRHWEMLTTQEWPPAKRQLPFVHSQRKCWSKRHLLQRLYNPKWETLNYPWQKKQNKNISKKKKPNHILMACLFTCWWIRVSKPSSTPKSRWKEIKCPTKPTRASLAEGFKVDNGISARGCETGTWGLNVLSKVSECQSPPNSREMVSLRGGIQSPGALWSTLGYSCPSNIYCDPPKICLPIFVTSICCFFHFMHREGTLFIKGMLF